MASIITDIPAYVFAWEVDTLKISAEQDTAVCVEVNNEVVFDVTLTPDSSGTIAIYNLADLINDSRWAFVARDSVTLSFWVDGTRTHVTRLVPCRANIGVPAATFYKENFLTLASSLYKRIPSDAVEQLMWLETDDETGTENVKVQATWVRQTDYAVKKTSEYLTIGGTEEEFAYVDASPSKLTAPVAEGDWRLVEYGVNVNGREQYYRIAMDGLSNQNVTRLQFVGNFGETETFYFFGSLEKEMKPDYSAAIINGRQQNYLVEAQPTWTAETGPMGRAEMLLFEDLCTATDVKNLGTGRPVAITEASYKPTNAWADTPAASLSWQDQKRGNVQNVTLPAQTFDSSFDSTYE